MKISKQYLLMMMSAIFLLSCSSQREFTYFQDVKINQHIKGVSNEVKEYKIKPYDNLYISIKCLNPEVNELFDANRSGSMYSSQGTVQMYGDYVSQYINGYQVDSMGTISLPVLGTVEVAELTLKQTQEKILKKSLEFLKEPAIKVKLLSFKINVTGEVKVPGVYYSYNEKLSILEAISLANGATDNAKLKKVLVVRQTENGFDSYCLDLTKKNLFTSEAYYLQPNDLVYIKPSKNKKLELNRDYYSLFLSTITTILIVFNLLK